jgi:hypothetical protein
MRFTLTAAQIRAIYKQGCLAEHYGETDDARLHQMMYDIVNLKLEPGEGIDYSIVEGWFE